MSGWIPVTERLPKPQQFVLIAYRDTYSQNPNKVTMGWYVPAKTVESKDEDEVDDEYDEASDTYYFREQWVSDCRESEYHYQISNVTHWMPLPEFPRTKEPMENRESVEQDAMRYRVLRNSELFCIDEKDSIGQWEPVGDLDSAVDAVLRGGVK